MKNLASLSPNAIALVSFAFAAPSAALEESDWQKQLETLKAQFQAECQSQQISGAVNFDINRTLSAINDQIEVVLKTAGIDVIRINNGQRFYVTDQVYKTGKDVDLVINNFVAQRFPSCSKSNKLVSN